MELIIDGRKSVQDRFQICEQMRLSAPSWRGSVLRRPASARASLVGHGARGNDLASAILEVNGGLKQKQASSTQQIHRRTAADPPREETRIWSGNHSASPRIASGYGARPASAVSHRRPEWVSANAKGPDPLRTSFETRKDLRQQHRSKDTMSPGLPRKRGKTLPQGMESFAVALPVSHVGIMSCPTQAIHVPGSRFIKTTSARPPASRGSQELAKKTANGSTYSAGGIHQKKSSSVMRGNKSVHSPGNMAIHADADAHNAQRSNGGIHQNGSAVVRGSKGVHSLGIAAIHAGVDAHNAQSSNGGMQQNGPAVIREEKVAHSLGNMGMHTHAHAHDARNSKGSTHQNGSAVQRKSNNTHVPEHENNDVGTESESESESELVICFKPVTDKHLKVRSQSYIHTYELTYIHIHIYTHIGYFG
jgi:hypothetical protein